MSEVLEAPARSEVLGLVAEGRREQRKFTLEGFAAAVPYFQKAFSLDERCAPAFAALAETYALWGARLEILGHPAQTSYDYAMECAETAVKADPDCADGHRALAAALARGKRADPARRREAAARAVELGPEGAANWYERWRAFGSRLSDPAVLKALTLEPTLFGPMHDMGVALCMADRLEDALRYFRRAAALCPGNTLVRYNLAMTLDQLGRREEAASELARAKAELADDGLLELGRQALEEAPR